MVELAEIVQVVDVVAIALVVDEQIISVSAERRIMPTSGLLALHPGGSQMAETPMCFSPGKALSMRS